MTEMSLVVSAPQGGEVYSIEKIPGSETLIVQQARSNVLKNIDLSVLVKGLSRSSGLIYLAFNGVAGFPELTVGMTQLHDSLGKICGSCERELNVFVNKSRQIQNILLDAFGHLYDGDIHFSVETMKMCSTVARELASRADLLAKSFERLGNDTMQILSKTETVQGATEKDRIAVQKKIQELEAQTAKAKRLHDDIIGKKKKYERMYNDAAVKADEATDRAMTMSILTSLLEPISAGIGSAMAIYTGGAVTGAVSGLSQGLKGGGSAGGAASNTELVRARDEAETALNSAKTEEQEALAARDKASQSFEALSRQAEEGMTAAKTAREALEAATAADKARLQSAADTAESTARVKKEHAAKAQAELDKALASYAEKSQQLQARQQAYEQANSRLASQGGAGEKEDSLGKIAGDLRKEKSELFKLLQQKEDEETNNIREMQDCAIQIGLARVDVVSLDVAINSLYLAIGALRKVVVVLRMAQQFWDQMATACEQLSDTTLEHKLKLMAGKEFEQCARLIQSDRFKLEVVGYYAAWKAIEVVCTEYSAEAAKIQGQVFHDFSQNLSTEDRRALAQAMSQQLVHEASLESEENLKLKAELQQVIRETEDA